MKRLVIALAVLASFAAAIPAKAGNCTTTCNRYGNGQTCNTYCY